jgi:hypothetical protein
MAPADVSFVVLAWPLKHCKPALEVRGLLLQQTSTWRVMVTLSTPLTEPEHPAGCSLTEQGPMEDTKKQR